MEPVCVLNTFSKIIELSIFDQVSTNTKEFLSAFMRAYRKHYRIQYVLIRLANLDQNKALDCLHHDLLIAKLNDYVFDRKALKLNSSCLKGKKQCAGINDINSNFLELLWGVLQGSKLEVLLFNIFLINLFLFTTKDSLVNYAENNTLSTLPQTLHR